MIQTEQLPVKPAAKPVFIPHKPNKSQQVAARSIAIVERLLTGSLRCHWKDYSGLVDATEDAPVIFCLWHNRLAISMMVHRRYRRKLAALVSASKDGALLVAILDRSGVEHVRGSTSRRGPQALLELSSLGATGYDLAVTPDGPKGPRYVVQHGVISLAQITGLPIVAVTCNTQWKISLKSWDGFQIPLPFSRCELRLNEPFHIPREAGAAEREALRKELEISLNENTD